jgi:hypothetical protein
VALTPAAISYLAIFRTFVGKGEAITSHYIPKPEAKVTKEMFPYMAHPNF